MIITLANAKGGVAKTTSAVFLAAAYARRCERPVTVLDADPQGSASLWADLADENGETIGVTVEAANASTLKRVRRNQDAGVSDVCVVDAPPQGPLLRTAIECADFVIVPASPSPLDLQQAWATLADVPAGKPAAVLLTRAETNTTAYRDTVAALDRQGTPCFDAVVRKRQPLAKAMGHMPVKCYEYADVLDELLRVLDGRGE
ncbi:ParA family protein [Bifidobacterium aerophilum]|uniref:AAA family ATPase n=1 Tax=Bifidobacterium aerophilum TaxID=1798155 RepID=A0A6N9Z5P9_9BIFI|nr:ParA family protein [Bifidobacterium aerophilum]NEG89821.1 AAA family ATPase [Bifidobacterium aerophilum]